MDWEEYTVLDTDNSFEVNGYEIVSGDVLERPNKYLQVCKVDESERVVDVYNHTIDEFEQYSFSAFSDWEMGEDLFKLVGAESQVTLYNELEDRGRSGIYESIRDILSSYERGIYGIRMRIELAQVGQLVELCDDSSFLIRTGWKVERGVDGEAITEPYAPDGGSQALLTESGIDLDDHLERCTEEMRSEFADVSEMVLKRFISSFVRTGLHNLSFRVDSFKDYRFQHVDKKEVESDNIMYLEGFPEERFLLH